MTTESRKHPRFASQLNARLILTDGSGYECLVSDYSHSGMKLRWMHEEIPEQLGPMILEMQLSTPVRAEVDLVYQNGTTVGVKMHEADSQLFLEMQEFNQQTRKGGGLSEDQRQRFREQFISEANALIEKLPRQWVPEFAEASHSKADYARNTSEQQLWTKLGAQTEAKAAKFFERFSQILHHQMQRWQAGEPKLSDENEEFDGAVALSLVRQSDFEDWLQAKVAASHLQSFLSQESFELRQLLDTLSQAAPEHCFNPIGPNTVTEAFRDSIDALDLPHEARELAFDTFEKVAVAALKSVYQSVIRQINIPITFRFRRQRETPVVTDASQTPATDTKVQEAYEAHSRRSDPERKGSSLFDFQRHQGEAQQAYSNIQHLLTLRYQRELQEGAESSLPEAAPEQITELVESLSRSAPLSEKSVREELEQQLAEKEVSLPEETRQAIDTMEQVTRNLLDNPSLAEFIKPSIEQLGWPLLRLMLKDPSLLFNPEHPGRLILNLLGRLGRITSSGQKRLRAALEEMIDPVLQAPSSDPKHMEDLVENLQLLVGSAERKVKQNTERVAQSAEGEYRLFMAHKRVNALIGKDTSERVLPQCVIEWLQEGWQQMLCLLLLREGADSTRFKGAVKLYRQVLILFNANNSGREDLLEKLTPLLTLARKELDQLNGPQPKHAQWQDDIMAAAVKHLQQGEMPDAINLPEFEEQEEETLLKGKGARRVLSLQVGDWLMITDQQQIVSIAWVSADQSRYACVNHTGMRVHDYRFNELAKAMEEGTIKRIYEQEDTPVDQSIDKLVQQIYTDLSLQANTDPLTGLTNRQQFLQQLDTSVSESAREPTSNTLCMIDVDQFKLINKNYGVEAGDTALQTIATILQEEMPDAICARIGSNEFAVLLEEQDIERAEASARMLMKAVEKTDIDTGKDKFRLRVSIGLAVMSADTTDAADLLEQAEIACQLAKEKGSSRIVRYEYDDASRQRHEQFMVWGNRLNQAFEEDRIRILCVPIEPIQSRHKGTIQYEVVISIQTEDGEEIPPIEFLQAAESYNRMYMLDRWIIEQLVYWLSTHEEEAENIRRFVLRLSARAVSDESLLEYLTEQAREHDVPVGKLCFELNETSALHDLGDAAEFMHELRTLGCRFVLSDFGTGQSSYNYLKALPVDFVKIDRNFIDGLHSSSADYALIKSIQEIAQFMAKKTIAENSDNVLVWDILRGIGIDYGVVSEKQAVHLDDLTQV